MLNLRSLLLDEPVEKTVLSLCDSELWYLSAEQFQIFKEAHPAVIQAFSQQVTAELRQVTSQVT